MSRACLVPLLLLLFQMCVYLRETAPCVPHRIRNRDTHELIYSSQATDDTQTPSEVVGEQSKDSP